MKIIVDFGDVDAAGIHRAKVDHILRECKIGYDLFRSPGPIEANNILRAIAGVIRIGIRIIIVIRIVVIPTTGRRTRAPLVESAAAIANGSLVENPLKGGFSTQPHSTPKRASRTDFSIFSAESDSKVRSDMLIALRNIVNKRLYFIETLETSIFNGFQECIGNTKPVSQVAVGKYVAILDFIAAPNQLGPS